METEAQSCAHCGAALTTEWTCAECGQAAPIPWSSPVGRSSPDGARGMPAPFAPASGSQTTGVCVQCGGTPAAEVTFKQGVGMLFMRRVRTTGGCLCRDCGLALGRKALNKTLITGWWGTFSLFMNFVYIAHDAAGLRELNALAGPQPASAHRLDPGRPVFHRAGALIALSVLVVTGTLVANLVKGPDHKDNGVAWVVGACVTVDGRKARAVQCADSHDSRVTRVVSSANQCDGGTGAVTVQGRVYCVDSDISGIAN